MNTKNLKIALFVGLGLHFSASDLFAHDIIGACLEVSKKEFQCCYNPAISPEQDQNYNYICNQDPGSLASNFTSLPSNCCSTTQQNASCSSSSS